MPQRTEKPGIDANIAEHRPLYLFGLNLEKEGLTPTDRTGKAQKSHAAFVETNLKFIEEMDTPLVNISSQLETGRTDRKPGIIKITKRLRKIRLCVLPDWKTWTLSSG